jgi:endonuclease III
MFPLCSILPAMQPSFAFCGGNDVERWRQRLAPGRDDSPLPGRRPIGQLVKSLISGRTKDPVSLSAYRRLCARFGSARRIAAAPVDEIAATIAEVTFAEAKAQWLSGALAAIAEERQDLALEFLDTLPLDDALAWLERLPGVGRKVAASTLNASTLRRPVFIVDTHVLRVLQRLGFAGPHADARRVSEAMAAAVPHWSGEDFLRFHIACKRLGQQACHAGRPECAACPLAFDCPSRLT